MVDVCSGLLPFWESWKLAGGQVPNSCEKPCKYWVVWGSGFKTIVFYCHKATAINSSNVPSPWATATARGHRHRPHPQPASVAAVAVAVAVAAVAVAVTVAVAVAAGCG